MYLLKSYLHSMYKIYVYANNKYQIAYEQLEQTLTKCNTIDDIKQYEPDINNKIDIIYVGGIDINDLSIIKEIRKKKQKFIISSLLRILSYNKDEVNKSDNINQNLNINKILSIKDLIQRLLQISSNHKDKNQKQDLYRAINNIIYKDYTNISISNIENITNILNISGFDDLNYDHNPFVVHFLSTVLSIQTKDEKIFIKYVHL